MTDAGAGQPPGQDGGYWGQLAPPPAPVAPPPPVSPPPPGYGYGPPPGPMYASPPIQRSTPTYSRYRVTGLVLVSVGGLMVLLSITTLDWSGSGLFAKDFDFFHEFSNEPGPGLTKLYFGWLAYVLIGVSLPAAYLVRLAGLRSVLIRSAVGLFSLAAAGLSFGAFLDGNSFHDVMQAADTGFWFAVVGFVVIAAGALLPP